MRFEPQKSWDIAQVLGDYTGLLGCPDTLPNAYYT